LGVCSPAKSHSLPFGEWSAGLIMRYAELSMTPPNLLPRRASRRRPLVCAIATRSFAASAERAGTIDDWESADAAVLLRRGSAGGRARRPRAAVAASPRHPDFRTSRSPASSRPRLELAEPRAAPEPGAETEARRDSSTPAMPPIGNRPPSVMASRQSFPSWWR